MRTEAKKAYDAGLEDGFADCVCRDLDWPVGERRAYIDGFRAGARIRQDAQAAGYDPAFI